MKSFSLELYPNETLYSYLVRSRLLSGYPSSRDFLQEFIGSAHCQLSAVLPSFIPQLAQETQVSAQVLIEQHTLFSYLKAFLNPQVAEQTYSYLLQGNAKELHSQLSLTANRLKCAKQLKYCPVCAINDINTYGVAYWHINHQLPWMVICIEHQQWLVSKTCNRRALLLPEQTLELQLVGFEIPERVNLFAQLSQDLLEQGNDSLNLSRLVECYLARLVSHELSTNTGSIRQAQWFENIKQYWEGSLSTELSSQLIEQRSSTSFPTCLIYQPHAQHHPVKHLLIIGYLFGSLNEFFSCYHDPQFSFRNAVDLMKVQQKQSAFQRINNLKLKIIQQLKTSASLRSVAKGFGVSVTFVKNIAIQESISINTRAQRIFSPERSKIKSMLKKGTSTEKIAAKMKCSTAAVEQVLTQHPAIKTIRTNLRYFKLQQCHRKCISGFIAKDPGITRGNLQKLARASYTWLFKHDKAWLYETLPKAIPRKDRYKGQ
jgi:hypothetical protein